MNDQAARYESARAHLAGAPDDPGILREFAIAAREVQKREEGLAAVKASYSRRKSPELYILLREICTFPEFQDVELPEGGTEAIPKEPPPGVALDRIPLRKYSLLLDQIVFYPVADGQAIWVLGSAAVLLAIFGAVPAGGLVSILFCCYLMVYYWNVLTSSALGDRKSPGWPDFTSLWEVVFAFARWVMVVIGCFVPFFIVLGMAYHNRSVPQLVGAIALLLLGALYYPMALLVVALAENGWYVFNAPLMIKSIAKIWKDYLICFAFVVASYALSAFLEYFLSGIRERSPLPVAILVSLLVRGIAIYAFTLQMRAIGLLYFARSKDLAWFN